MENRQKKWWMPDLYMKNNDKRMYRICVIHEIRRFFEHEGFAEVETPALQISPGLEVHLKAFETALYDPLNNSYAKYYLHTSPEFTMKKLLAAGLPRIFQMGKVYRNEAKSLTHHPEFTMLEWYRAQATYEQMMDDTERLVKCCTKACKADLLRRGERWADPFQTWQRLTVQEAFLKYTGIDVMATIPAEPTMEPDPTLLRIEAEKIGIKCSDTDRWEDIFFRIMLNCIEDKLGDGVPVILYDYPTCLGALARKKPTDSRVVERFEAYICGVELCNAFSELTDVTEQRQRFEYDMAMKEKLYGERYPLDEDFLEALSYMPDCAGNAVGVDRLVMLITGAESIEDVLWAPVA